MAVAKMKQVSLVVLKQDCAEMMAAIQAFQGVELRPLEENATIFETDRTQLAETTRKLQQLHSAQMVIKPFKPKKTMSETRQGRSEFTMEELTALTRENKFEQVTDDILALDQKRSQLQGLRKKNQEKQTELQPWLKLDVPLDEIPQLKQTQAEIGTVSSVIKSDFMQAVEKEKRPIYIEELSDIEGVTSYFLLYHQQDAETVDGLKYQYAFQTEALPKGGLPYETLQDLKKEERELVEREKETMSRLKELAKEYQILDLAEEYFETLQIRHQESEKLSQTEATVVLTGWLIADEEEAFKSFLSRKFPSGHYYLTIENITEEVAEEEIPVALTNNKLVEPFEMFTEMYSYPKYRQIDPTPFLTPFQLVFFGMMLADVGYGALLWIGTFILNRFFNLDRGLARSIRFFHLLSYATIVWGIIYGSAFGVELPFHVLSPTEDVIQILILSVVFGIIQILTGLAIGAYGSLRQNDMSGALSGSISWFLALTGVSLLALGKFAFEMPALVTVGLALIVIGVFLIVFMPVFTTKKSRIGGFFAGLWELYGATSYIGDIVSYTRLMALGLAGGSIASAFNTILAFLPTWAQFTIGIFLALAMHALNFFLSTLSAYVHSMRLQYVEFFGKFYDGGGRKFAPFKAAEKHIYLKQEKTK
ncbi:V-type ATP synthase subunit I [Vagococcus lutrae]|uniref:V-type ATP synthase subunit I n=1 Tax=Vagococcus lutrae TaxID=81947 RepID=UPI00200E4704|nr:V-type ATP synthase subunit I [Vagococcus lutrae]UQF38610.1 V-type ATP synthase subunit I [Vagococcus lutrae]